MSLDDSCNPSAYRFSASKSVECDNSPTVLECVAPSPPRRVRGVELTITRVFKNRPISLRKLKEPLRRRETSVEPSERTYSAAPLVPAVSAPATSQRDGSPTPLPSRRGGTPGPSTSGSGPPVPSTSQRSGTPGFSLPINVPERDLSPLSSVPSSPRSSPAPTIPKAVARARSPGAVPSASAPSARSRAAPYTKPSGSSSARLTRSDSRPSVKSGPKLGRGASLALMMERVDPNGGILTRYGEQDGDPIFIRDKKNTSTIEPDIWTYFWESFTALPLRQPVDLTSHDDLAIGDVYCNHVRGAKKPQLWIWTAGADGDGFWKRASQGDLREDGRRLSITPKRQQPSWVLPDWAMKQLRNAK